VRTEELTTAIVPALLVVAASGLLQSHRCSGNSANLRTDLSRFCIESSAPTVVFSTLKLTYVVTATIGVTTWVLTGAHIGLSSSSGSQQALLQVTIPAGTESVSLEAEASGCNPA
jgi:hypothetical protein